MIRKPGLALEIGWRLGAVRKWEQFFGHLNKSLWGGETNTT